MTRIGEAELDLRALEHEPEVVRAAPLARYATEGEQHHDAVLRQSIDGESMMQLPHQEVRVEVLRIDAY